MRNFFRILFLPLTATFEFITKYFKTVVFLTILFFIFYESDPVKIEQPNVEQINLSGPIISVEQTLEKIQKAMDDENIKGVLFSVNSPGGAVAPSVELAYAIKELNAKKPVVAYASGVMASGSYYASIWASKIVANPGSMIGSIGVIFQGMNIEELMQKIGVQTQTVKVGQYKEAGTFTRTWNEYEQQELEKVIQDTYNMFVSDVASARNLSIQEHTSYADAHIFTARQAKEVGLVDEVATLSFAKNELYALANIENPIWKEEDKFEKFFNKLTQETVSILSSYFVQGLKAY